MPQNEGLLIFEALLLFCPHSVDVCLHLSVCLSCPGPVKKCGLLKIVHDKYRPPTTKRLPPQEVREFHGILQDVAEQNTELKPFISKAQENLNPLQVLQLFERIPDEVVTCGYWWAISWVPVVVIGDWWVISSRGKTGLETVILVVVVFCLN